MWFYFVKNERKSASALFCVMYIFIPTYVHSDHIYYNACPCLQFCLYIATAPCCMTFMPFSKYIFYDYSNKYRPKCCVSYMYKNILKYYSRRIQFCTIVVRSDMHVRTRSKNCVNIYTGTAIYGKMVTRMLK
jgi:hypothetical protein